MSMTPEEYEARYNRLLFAATKTLREKEREYSKLVTAIVIVSAALFALWLHHEGQWEERLATAQGYCLIPESDGGCAAWDKSALVAEWVRLGR
jgi:hypothetical protein